MTLDPSLSFQYHFDKFYRKTSDGLRLLSYIREGITIHSAETIFRSMVIPILTYCSTVNINLHNTDKKKIMLHRERQTSVADVPGY